MNKKTGLSILGAIAGVFLCLISSTLYFWLGKLLNGTWFSSYYTGFYTVFIPFLVGIICFILLLLTEKMIQKLFRIKILNLSFYLVLIVSILACSIGIALYEGTKDEFGEIVFFLISAVWVTAGMLRSFTALYKDIKKSPYNKWYKNKGFYFAMIFMIINIIWAILCS